MFIGMMLSFCSGHQERHKIMKTNVLKYLKKSDGFISGEEMSQALKVSRCAVWKQIKQLREAGYAIEAISRRGYRLSSQPDKLFPEVVQTGLKTKIFGKKIFYFTSVESTMDLAAKLAAEGSREGEIVCAETQTKGRGRLGREWISSKDRGIYFSVILRPKVALSDASQLTLVFAVAICQAIRLSTGLDAMIKWPNDILIGEKKVAGILTELNAEMDRINFIVLGIGINVGGKLPSFLKEATCLEARADKKISRVELLQEVLRQSEKYYLSFQRQGFAPLADEWRKLSSTLKTNVKIIEVNKTTEGKAIDIDAQGALLIQKKDGSVVRKISGDVVHLRSNV